MDVNKWPFWYPGYRFMRAPFRATKYWFGNLKSFFMRGRMGWAPIDAWDTDSYLGKVIPMMLRHLADHHMGIPGYICAKYPNDDEAASKAWHDELISIAEKIEFANADEMDYNQYRTRYWNEDMTTNPEWSAVYYQEDALIRQRQEKAIKEAMNWIGEHWHNLWD